MKTQELRQLTPTKIHEELAKATRDLATARFHLRTGQSQNTAQIRKLRLVVARSKTLLKELALKGVDIRPPKKEKKVQTVTPSVQKKNEKKDLLTKKSSSSSKTKSSKK